MELTSADKLKIIEVLETMLAIRMIEDALKIFITDESNPEEIMLREFGDLRNYSDMYLAKFFKRFKEMMEMERFGFYGLTDWLETEGDAVWYHVDQFLDVAKEMTKKLAEGHIVDLIKSLS